MQRGKDVSEDWPGQFEDCQKVRAWMYSSEDRPSKEAHVRTRR